MTTILITNDDGFGSAGICALKEAMAELGETVVVAPERNRSAVSHSITMRRPLCVIEHDTDSYSVDGTPVDCAVLGIEKILPKPPDLVVSGINHGANIGDDLHYSATVAAAVEGCMHGCPAIAFSLDERSSKPHLAAAIPAARRIALEVLRKPLPKGTLLNVNFPRYNAEDGEGYKSIRFTRQGRRLWLDSVAEIVSPAGITHYWLGGGSPRSEVEKDTDIYAVQNGSVSITPIQLDFTHHKVIEECRANWDMDIA